MQVLAWQTACWSEDEQSLSPLGALPGQLDQLLAELENSLGVTRVQHALALLTASKHGLRDAEMLDLLARDPAFHSESTYGKSFLFQSHVGTFTIIRTPDELSPPSRLNFDFFFNIRV